MKKEQIILSINLSLIIKNLKVVYQQTSPKPSRIL